MSIAHLLGTELSGRYVVERELGRGGMATVFLARDLRHARAVAVKVMMRDLVAPAGTERFLHEIRFAARLTHPHVLGVHDSGEADGRLFRLRAHNGTVDDPPVTVTRGDCHQSRGLP